MLIDPITRQLLTDGRKTSAASSVVLENNRAQPQAFSTAALEHDRSQNRSTRNDAPGRAVVSNKIPCIVIGIAFLMILIGTVRRLYLGDRSLSEPTWGNVQAAARCSSYGIRSHSAVLLNVPVSPTGFSRAHRACQDTDLIIRGARLKPTECQLLSGGIVVGRFDVDDVGCKPYWGEFHDKGCIANGSLIRRIESNILYMRQEDDWMAMCSTMPAVIYGVHYATPTHCVNNLAIWEIEDAEC